MKIIKTVTCGRVFGAVVLLALLSSFTPVGKERQGNFHFPYQAGGLSDQQAAAHLLDRFTWGAKPGQIDEVVKMGLENWFTAQLNGDAPDPVADRRLAGMTGLKLTNAEIARTYLKGGQTLKMAIADGAVNKDSVSKADKPAYRARLQEYMQKKGIKSERELMRMLINQKIIKAVYSTNQLHEVLTDFWFNHFNVSFTKGSCAQFIPNYERDVIRPNVCGKFEDLLVATAKSPAMLLYLDNFSSVGAMRDPALARRPQQNKKMKGLNENYAREVMELHTMGVDGGYTQRDVTEGARILTGWTIAPMGKEGFGSGFQKLREKVGDNQLHARGFVMDGDFLFTPNRHDVGEKIYLGVRFPAGGGYNEGMRLLHMLASHPSTAHFISKKIATRFVGDEPPASLVDKLAAVWTDSGGDLRAVLTAMVSSDEFWNASSLREKTKSPFELVTSTARALNADVSQPYQLFAWINRIGQQLYSYQAPTGFPDRGQYWINTGSLLNRMNFGLAFADGRIKGITFDLLALNSNHEPESAESALLVYSKLMMPERPTDATIRRLTPLLNDPQLDKKIGAAAGDLHQSMKKNGAISADSLSEDTDTQDKIPKVEDKYRLSQVVGILIGSPEFQRR